MSLARQAAPGAVRRLVALMDSNDERVAVVACNSILDRALGKPREQPAETETELDDMTDEQRARWAYAVMERAKRLLEAPVIEDKTGEMLMQRGQDQHSRASTK